MAFPLSPSVIVTEKDLTNIVPAVSTSVGAYAGVFAWGPAMQPFTVTSEKVLVENFSTPNDSNFMSFWSAANFLAYSNNLLLVRVLTSGLRTACTTPGGTNTLVISNSEDYSFNHSSGVSTNGEFAAKYLGTMGNSLRIELADSASYATWAFKYLFTAAPGTSTSVAANGGSEDELHIVIVDEDGAFTGTAGTVLETFAFVSKSKDSLKSDGTNNYYKNVLNTSSKYIWWLAHPTAGANWGGALSVDFATLSTVFSSSMSGGADDYTATDGEIQSAYDLFVDSDTYDVNLIIAGKANATVARYLVQNVAEIRKDAIVFISPQDSSTGDIIVGKGSSVVTALLEYRSALNLDSSYGVLDTGYKYQYDKYNDVMRYVPLNADIAGLAARTDYTTDPWFSPAGYNRGQIKGVVKLAVTLNQTERDQVYPKGINPVIVEKTTGSAILYGDRTLLSKPSAFDRINVRRLFIVLEKAIATAAKYQLFEFNDSFTRAQFRNLVEPFLRDVQGRRGITDFRVVCNETNNTAEVIDRNEFVGDILVKPSRSINTIRLNFVAVRSSANFTEVGG